MKNKLINYFYTIAGIVFLCLAKLKHGFQGYKTPKPFGMSETELCIEHDMRTVGEWLELLNTYAGSNEAIANKRVLELGPGSDLGCGLMLLAHGAQSYTAVDVHDLADNVPALFYEKLFEQLQKQQPHVDIEMLKSELQAQQQGRPGRLKFVCSRDFNFTDAVGKGSIDVVFSQAAFEHFDNLADTVRQLSAVCSGQAVAVITVDLQTHSRWIRDKDPNNIYRYPEWLYRAFHFKGTPNRIRPYQYKKLFEQSGWKDVCVRTLSTLDSRRVAREMPYLAAAFRNDKAEMHALSLLIYARRPSLAGAL